MTGASVGFAHGVVVDWNLRLVRGLPDAIARDRIDEIASDLWEQEAVATRRGRRGVRLAASMLIRALRGAPADLTWRLARRGADPARQAVRRGPRPLPQAHGFDQTNGAVDFDVPADQDPQEAAAAAMARSATTGSLTF